MNIPKGFTVKDASLKHQCYSDYLYGKNPFFEKNLSQIESDFSKLLSDIDTIGTLPPPFSEDHIVMLYMILIQDGRTQYAADSLKETNDKISSLTGQIYNEYSFYTAAEYSTSIHLTMYPILLDLNARLVINNTQEEFITSDCPIIKINPFLSFLDEGNYTGLGNIGLMILFPISPKKMIILFDSKTYRLGSDSKHIIHIQNSHDVSQINIMQMASCENNIYYRKAPSDHHKSRTKSLKFRRLIKANVKKITDYKDNNGNSREIIINYSEPLKCIPKLTFMSVRKSAKIYKQKIIHSGSLPGKYLRNESLVSEYHRFMEAVKNGQFEHHEFIKYIDTLNDKLNKSS